jgi:hypothetical protein
MSFGALAFLVAVVTIFIELSRDQIVVSMGFHSRVLWSARILAAETLVWLCIELGRIVTIPLVPCSGTVIVGTQVLMVVGIAVTTVLLTNVVREVGVMVRDGYVHAKKDRDK